MIEPGSKLRSSDSGTQSLSHLSKGSRGKDKNVFCPTSALPLFCSLLCSSRGTNRLIHSQNGRDLSEGGGPAISLAQASVLHTVCLSDVHQQCCVQTRKTQLPAATVMGSSGTCRVLHVSLSLAWTPWERQVTSPSYTRMKISFLSQTSSSSAPRWSLNRCRTTSSLQHWRSQDVWFSINIQTSLSLRYMETEAVIDLQLVNECKAPHLPHRPRTCWVFLWRPVVCPPTRASVSYMVRIPKSHRLLSS